MPENEGWTHYHRWGPCGWGYERFGFLGSLRLGVLELSWVRGNLFEECAELTEAHRQYVGQAKRLKADLAAAYEALRAAAPQRDPETGRFRRRG